MLILGVAAVSLTACGINAPRAEIAYAEAIIVSARNVGAHQYAGVELERAKGKLYQAKAAMRDGENEKSLRLANESTVTASLAEAKTAEGKAKLAESQMQESLQVLKAQLR